MRKPMVWNPLFALAGLGALLIYILACTSFSPDDSKVLYGTVDAKSGLTGVAVYDRKAGTSELLFEPFIQDLGKLGAQGATLRPQWIENGHYFLTTWVAGSDDSDRSLNLAVLPFDRGGPARTFRVPDLGKDASTMFIRLDLETGKMYRQTNQTEMVLLPSPNNDRLFYLGGVNDANGPDECGFLNSETFARTPLFQIKEKKVSMWSLALSRDAKRLAYQVEDEHPPVVHLLETGQPARTLSPLLAKMRRSMSANFRPEATFYTAPSKIPRRGRSARSDSSRFHWMVLQFGRRR